MLTSHVPWAVCVTTGELECLWVLIFRAGPVQPEVCSQHPGSPPKVRPAVAQLAACSLTGARRLTDAGHSIGYRFLETVFFKERPAKRETKLLGMLQFVSSVAWKALFGKGADALEKSRENDDECACVACVSHAVWLANR